MMLSRVAQGLFELGRWVERARHVAQTLEVSHKMNLERVEHDETEVWRAVSNAFDSQLVLEEESEIYDWFVLSNDHPYSVRRCVNQARFEGRAMREHISEEMWLHLNHTHLEFTSLAFDSILTMGRSEFNRRITIFADALTGLADDTMIRGEAWAFLRTGKLVERASMICKILRIKEKSITPELDGAPIDVHQWQALLRSLSGYEPYRRAYDARIIPSRVLEFVLMRRDFPRSLAGCLLELRNATAVIAAEGELPSDLDLAIVHLMEVLRITNPEKLLEREEFSSHLKELESLCQDIATATRLSFFTVLRPDQAHEFELRSVAAVIQQ